MGMFPGSREAGGSAAGGVVQARAGAAGSRHGRQHGAGVQLTGVCASTRALAWGRHEARRLRGQRGLGVSSACCPGVGRSCAQSKGGDLGLLSPARPSCWPPT